VLADGNRGEKQDLEAIEIATRKAMHKCGAGLLKVLLRHEAPDDDEREVDCQCGGRANYVDLRSKRILTVVGEVEIVRAYYLCGECHVGQSPADKKLDVERTALSPGVRRMMAMVGSQVPFDSGRQQMEYLAELSVTTKSIERTAEAIGWDIGCRQEKLIEETMNSKVVEKREKVPLLYIEMDATGIPVVPAEIDPEESGKNEGKPPRTREAKLGCVFTQTKLDQKGRPVRDEASTTYVGAIEPAHEFGRRIYTEARQRGLDGANKVVVIGDGAQWIWNLAQTHFPGAVEILDIYHARQRLWDLSAKLFPRDDAERKRWAKWMQKKLLDKGKIKRLVNELRSISGLSRELREEVETEAAYFERNAHRMNYPKFKKQKLFIGSGVVEAACKNVIGYRLKQSGMFWTVRGANAILALRCCRLSGYFENYWESRPAA
jgi:hypothetical protein